MKDILKRKADEALWHVHNRRPDHAMPLIQELIEADHPAAYFIEGRMYQLGGYTVPVDLHRAAESFRKAAGRAPSAACYLDVARVLLDLGGDSRDEALTWIEAAAANGNPPDTELAFARYYREGEPPALRAAVRYYRRAFLRGRTAGMFHLASMRWDRGQCIRSALLAVVAWISVPFALVVVGKQSRNTFGAAPRAGRRVHDVDQNAE